MISEIKKVAKKPPIYQKSEAEFWNDPYIAQRMLEAHLNPELESATRKLEFVQRSVNWISELLPSERYKRLLDLGCGPGIYAEQFYSKGYQVSGLDLSENSIGYAQKIAYQKGSAINYKLCDYVQAPITGEYDLITMIYCDFGVLSSEERKILLKKIHDVLSPKGCFLFDVFTPFEYKDRSEYKSWIYEDKGFWRDCPYLLLQSLYCYEENNTFLNQYIVATECDTTCYNLWEHTFTVDELKKDLLDAGFQNVRIFGDVAGTEHESDSKTICVVAEKR